MWQVLFTIPVAGGIPIYGFGLMLFLAYLLSVKLSSHLAKREGVDPDLIQDLAIWLFVGGLLGARTTYLVFHDKIFQRYPFVEGLWEFIKNLPRIWDGGIILYGSVAGGTLAYFLAYFLVYRKRGISTLQLADIIAPGAALGVCLGRLGCLLNGCCYGQVACPSCPGVEFPLSAPARVELTAAGLQTAAGFTIDPHLPTVARVSEGHGGKGLVVGDVVLRVNQTEVTGSLSAERLLEWSRLRGELEPTVQVQRGEEVLTYRFRVPPTGFVVSEPAGPRREVRVESVDTGSSAAAAGLEVGDVIETADAGSGPKPVRDGLDLATVLLARKEVTLTVRQAKGATTGRKPFKVPETGFEIRDVDRRVGQVVPGSPAATEAELRPGDIIVAVNDRTIDTLLPPRGSDQEDHSLESALVDGWPRGATELRLAVERQGQRVELKPIEPRTLKLHPTQLYESVSMALLVLVLLAYFPLRTSRGQVMALLMICYACHRTVNELLRNDIRPIGLELGTSGVLLLGGVVMFVWLRYRPVPPTVPTSEPATT